MEVARYCIRGRTVAAADPVLQDALALVYQTPERPRCMCVAGGVEMYVARVGAYVLKRMPGTGGEHAPGCQSFEPDASLSGLGELLGDAIVEQGAERVEIRTDFPLARAALRATGASAVRGSAGSTPAAVAVPRRQLSLRAVLHLLYHRAGLNRWYPAMQGKRSQAVIRKYLELAAQDVVLKGHVLASRLYVPGPFRVADKEDIAVRRRQRLSMLMAHDDDGSCAMALLIGQFNGAEPTPYGHRLLVKHMPDAPLYMDDKAWARTWRAYGPVLQALDADVEHQPMALMAALVYVRREHLYQVDALTMMLVTDQWIPLEGLHELALVERLQQQGRAFLKPLRFDARNPAAFANALLLDAEGGPCALHVVSPFLDPKERAAKEKAVKTLGQGAWVWRTDEVMPVLPGRAARQGRAGSGEAAHHLA